MHCCVPLLFLCAVAVAVVVVAAASLATCHAILMLHCHVARMLHAMLHAMSMGIHTMFHTFHICVASLVDHVCYAVVRYALLASTPPVGHEPKAPPAEVRGGPHGVVTKLQAPRTSAGGAITLSP